MSSVAVRFKAKREAYPLTRTRILYGLTTAALVGFAVGLSMSLFYAKMDALQGNVQRIFYFHVAAFSGAAVAFATTVFGSVVYLWKRQAKWDALALAGVEVGLALSIITLITGSVWARPTWNTWWTWDPRLTSAAVMVLTYTAYLMLRGGIENVDKRRVFASVYGILAISTVIFTFVIIRIKPDTIHPTVIGPSSTNAQGGFAMTETMRATLGMNSFIWVCLIAPALIWWRVRLEQLFERVNFLKAQANSQPNEQ